MDDTLWTYKNKATAAERRRAGSATARTRDSYVGRRYAFDCGGGNEIIHGRSPNTAVKGRELRCAPGLSAKNVDLICAVDRQ